MHIITDIRSVQLPGPTVMTIGNFDGVHRGHQALLGRLAGVAQALAEPTAMTAIVTFEPHPLSVLRPDTPLKLLTTPLERLLIAGGLGIDLGVIQPFSRELAALEPREFVRVLKEQLGLFALVVGPDFALGRGRSGTLDVLSTLGEEMGFRLIVMEPISWEGQPVRSNMVRYLLAEGRVDRAADLLGRLYHVTGTVQVGDRLGHRIGVPTANLAVPETKLWPGNGVYATRTWVRRSGDAEPYASVTNIGVRPTVNGAMRRLESHLLDYAGGGENGDLYGQELTVEFVSKLRDERKFAGLEELVAQIRADIAAARPILAAARPAEKPFFLAAPG